MPNELKVREAAGRGLTLADLFGERPALVPAAAPSSGLALAELAPRAATVREEREKRERRAAEQARLAEQRRNRQQVYTTD